MQTKQVSINKAIQGAIAQVNRQQYSDEMKKNHNCVYKALRLFSERNHGGLYTFEIGTDFIDTLSRREITLSKTRFRMYVNAIDRINHVIEGEVDWHPPRIQRKEYNHSCFDKVVNEYETHLMRKGLPVNDVRARLHRVSRFLSFVDLHGIKSLQSLTTSCIYSAFQNAKEKRGFSNAVSLFLRYAHKRSLTVKDFSLVMPSVTRHKPVPSVYSPEEVELLLASINRDSTTGKRDYALTLIAARLGLRSGDICSLTFENIHYAAGRIDLVQSKTDEPISLPLLREVREALTDYIENARPDYDSSQIFLKIPHPYTGPLSPVAFASIIRRLFSRVPFDNKGRKRGPHALRSSLATALLDEGNDYPTIQKALGHRSQNEAKSYVKVDVEHLRPFALAVPEPTTAFHDLLDGQGVPV